MRPIPPASPRRPRAAAAAVCCCALLSLFPQVALAADERRNGFDDPFAQVTNGLFGCPAPAGPLFTSAEMCRGAHRRIERGATRWLAKQGEEPNAYARDGRINAEVVRCLAADPRWRDTRLWVITQRRFVLLQGCVRSATQKRALLDSVHRMPGVEYLGDPLLIGTGGKPPYRSAAAAGSGGAGRN